MTNYGERMNRAKALNNDIEKLFIKHKTPLCEQFEVLAGMSAAYVAVMIDIMDKMYKLRSKKD